MVLALMAPSTVPRANLLAFVAPKKITKLPTMKEPSPTAACTEKMAEASTLSGQSPRFREFASQAVADLVQRLANSPANCYSSQSAEFDNQD